LYKNGVVYTTYFSRYPRHHSALLIFVYLSMILRNLGMVKYIRIYEVCEELIVKYELTRTLTQGV
jgi:hypothetical protein